MRKNVAFIIATLGKQQEEQRKQIVNLYLQCHTLEEISKN
jgi:hypothetical protein